MPGHRDVLEIKFGAQTPFFPLSVVYGTVYEPREGFGGWYISAEHYVACRMLARPEHQRRIRQRPNGYLAHVELHHVLQGAHSTLGSPVVVPGWEDGIRDDAMLRCARLRVHQSDALRRLLLDTNERAIVDDSRATDLACPDDHHWFHMGGAGRNAHGRILERVRGEARRGELEQLLRSTP